MKSKWLINITIIVIVIFLIAIFYPLIYFTGWLCGQLIRFTIGNLIVNGLSSFNITITTNQIPTICGILNIIGSFFHRGEGYEKQTD